MIRLRELALYLIAAALRVAVARNSPVWIDESNVVDLIGSYSGPALAAAVLRSQPHSPVWYLLVEPIGPSVTGLRAVSIVAGVGTVVAVYHGLADIGEEVRLIAAGIVAVSPYHIWWSSMARPYALLGLLSAVAIVGVVRARPRAAALSAALAIAIHPFGAVLTPLVGGWLIVRGGLGQGAIALGAVSSAMLGIIGYKLLTGNGGLTHLTPPSAWLVASTPMTWGLGYAYNPASAVLLTGGLLTLAIEATWRWRSAVLAGWVVVVILTTAMVSAIRPIYAERYLFPGAIGGVVVVALLLDTITPAGRRLIGLELLGAAVIELPSVGQPFFA